MLTPRNEGVPQNMERVDEDQEEDLAGHEESQQQIVGNQELAQMNVPAS